MKAVAIGLLVEGEATRLPATLAALYSQTHQEIEWLLLDDTSGTKTAEESPGSLKLRRICVEQPGGRAASFNRLAEASNAAVIVLLESGALVGPGWLERLLAGLAAHPRNGLAGPSTNRSWNAQAVAPGTGESPAEIARCAAEVWRRFGDQTRTLEPLYSLADFCYAVRREVIEDVGLADEGYGSGPCWEMDYNIRAARAGWRGVWVGAAYVHRARVTERHRIEEARWFEASKHRYQDKFCGARLRGEKSDYRAHCRGEACPNFAPARLIQVGKAEPPAIAESTGDGWPLVTCIMPTCDRHRFVPEALRYFFRQDYPNLELVIVDDGAAPVAPLLPDDPRVRLIRLSKKMNVGAKRNAACAAARGEFIVHWDDDDWYPADRVTRQIAALKTGGAQICGTSTLFYYDEESTARRAWRYRYLQRERPWVAGNTFAYRKSWWLTHRFPEIQVGEDSRFVWAAPREAVCDLAPAELCVARIHARNTSRKSPGGSYWQACEVAVLEAMLGSEWPAFAGLASHPARGGDPAQTPLISCIMPTYNRRPFLALALKAFAAQDYPAKELVVVDDGSDAVGDLVAKIPEARYVRLASRASIGEKRNRACAEARGAIIAHWDDDDWYAPERLSRQVAPLLAGEADLAGLENAFVCELPAGRFWGTSPELHRRMFVGDVHGGTLMFWKKLFTEGLRYPLTNIAEDAAFIQAAVRRGKRLLRVPNDGVFVYFRHGGNAWRFQAGRFLDPRGWKSVQSPGQFPASELEWWQRASEASCRGVLVNP